MNIDAILKWLEETAFAGQIRDSLLLFPMLESIHVIGFALVFGTIIVIDLRLLGLASTHRAFNRVAADILKWTWVAFAITAVTGVLMFTTNPVVYFHNTYFQAKMALLVLSGINMFAFELTARRTVKEWDALPSAPRSGRTVAMLSLVIWIGVIFTGRLIGFSTSRVRVAPPLQQDVNFEDFLR